MRRRKEKWLASAEESSVRAATSAGQIAAVLPLATRLESSSHHFAHDTTTQHSYSSLTIVEHYSNTLYHRYFSPPLGAYPIHQYSLSKDTSHDIAHVAVFGVHPHAIAGATTVGSPKFQLFLIDGDTMLIT